ncbi:MAG: baseplate J/gp47 family protein, partial [Ktedonobacteraceae bacterium]
RGRVLLVALVALIILTLLVCGGIAAAAPGTFNSLKGAVSRVVPGASNAAVTITPKNQLLTESFAIQAVTGSPNSANRQVQAAQLTYTTPPSTKTVNATGHQQTPATNATGTLTFYNATGTSKGVSANTVFQLGNGVQIENTVFAYVPAAHGNPPTEGSVTVDAKALTSGSRGNIAANTLYLQPCCGGNSGITVSNTAAFHGGQDPQNYTFVQQSDVDNAASVLEPGLRTQAMTGFNGQKKAGQQLVAEPSCSTKTTASPPVGAKANSTTVTVTASCSGEVYDLAGADKLAQKLLAQKAASNPGAGYALTGNIVTYPPQITSVEQSGTIDLVIKTQGVWVYQFSDAAKTHLAQLIAGKSKDAALALLLQQAGVAQASISIANNGTTLPTDPTQISFTVQSVPGAPTPTVTATSGPPITPVASPTQGNG